MAFLELLIEGTRVTSPDEQTPPQEILRLRRQNLDWLRRIGEHVVVLHRYTVEDIDSGDAVRCPGCYNYAYDSVRSDCQICFGVGIVSKDNDPDLWISLDGRTVEFTNPGNGVNAPVFGGYSSPYLTFMVEPDRPTDIFQISEQGALIRTKEAQGFAPWFPTLYDNDLCVNVILDHDNNILAESSRFLLANVNPVTIRGFGRKATLQQYLVAQEFEMQRVPNEDPHILYQVPLNKRRLTQDSGTAIGIGVPVNVDHIFAVDAGSVVATISFFETDEVYAINDFRMVLSIAQISAIENRIYPVEATTITGVFPTNLAISDTTQFIDAATITSSASMASDDIHNNIDVNAGTITGVSVETATDTAQYVEGTIVCTSVASISALEERDFASENTTVTSISSTGLLPENTTLPDPNGLFNSSDIAQYADNGATCASFAAPSATDSVDWAPDSAQVISATTNQITGSDTNARYVQTIGTKVQGATATTIVISSTVSTTAGNTIVVVVQTSGSTGTTCTDSKSNTYLADAINHVTGVGDGLAIFRASNTTALTNTDTITVTCDSSATNKVALAAEYFGIATSNPLDKEATNSTATTTNLSPTVSTPSNTSQAAEVVIGGIVWKGSGATVTLSAGTGFTLRTEIDQSTNHSSAALIDQVVTSIGTYTPNGTLSGNTLNGWNAGVVTYKAT